MDQLGLKTSEQLKETFGSLPQGWRKEEVMTAKRGHCGQAMLWAGSPLQHYLSIRRVALQVWGGKGNCWVVSHLTPQITSGDSLTPNKGSC